MTQTRRLTYAEKTLIESIKLSELDVAKKLVELIGGRLAEKNALGSFSAKDESGDTILALAIENSCTFLFDDIIQSLELALEQRPTSMNSPTSTSEMTSTTSTTFISSSARECAHATLFSINKNNQSLITIALKKNDRNALRKVIALMKQCDSVEFIKMLSLSEKIKGWTPLHYAAAVDPLSYTVGELSNKKEDTLTYFLNVLKSELTGEEFIFQLNRSNLKGDSPLHRALKNENTRAAARLVMYGADYRIVNNENKSSFEYCLQLSFEKQSAQFKEWNAIKEIAENWKVNQHYYHCGQKLKNEMLDVHRNQLQENPDQDDTHYLALAKASGSLKDLIISQMIRADESVSDGERLQLSEKQAHTLVFDGKEKKSNTPKPKTLADHEFIHLERRMLFELIKMLNEKAADIQNNLQVNSKKRLLLIGKLFAPLFFFIIAETVFSILLDTESSCTRQEVQNRIQYTYNGNTRVTDYVPTNVTVYCNDIAQTGYVLSVSMLPILLIGGYVIYCCFSGGWRASHSSWNESRPINKSEWEKIKKQLKAFFDAIRSDKDGFIPETHNQWVQELKNKIELLNDDELSPQQTMDALNQIAAALLSGQEKLNGGEYRKGLTVVKNSIFQQPIELQEKQEEEKEHQKHDRKKQNDTVILIDGRDDHELDSGSESESDGDIEIKPFIKKVK